MPTLDRPGVDITQVVTPASPTVLTPTLGPCIVGPCFQIVSPLVDGTLNSSAEVAAAALLEADAVYAGPVDLSGAKLKLHIGSAPVEIQFPTVAAGKLFTKELITNTLNATLSTAAAYCTYGADDYLRIFTVQKGSTASITIDTTDSENTAAANLHLTTSKTVTGKDKYRNLAYVLPFSSLPTTKAASTADLKFSPDALDMYRFDGADLLQFSKTRAINWTSQLQEVLDSDPTLGQALAPWNRVSLTAAKSTSIRTNLLISEGTPASLDFPLSVLVSGTNVWPDPAAQNFIRFTCRLPSALSSPAAALIGTAGNAVSVAVVQASGQAENCLASYNSSTKTITLSVKNLATCTYLDLSTALGRAAFTNVATDPTTNGPFSIQLHQAASNTALPFAAISDGTSASLFGGLDPINFAAATNDGGKATITGQVYFDSTATPDDIGLTGMRIGASVDGTDWIYHTFASGADTTLVQLQDAFPLLTISTVQITPPFGSATDVLQFKAAGEKDGADSTIMLFFSDDEIGKKLFSGFITASNEALATGSLLSATAWGTGGITGRRVHLTGGTGGNFNQTASTAGQTSLVPDSVSVSLTGLTVKGFIALKPLSNGGIVTAGTDKLAIAYDGGSAVELTFSAHTYADLSAFAAGVASLISSSALAGDVTVSVTDATDDVDRWLILSPVENTAGIRLQLGSATTSTVKNYLQISGDTLAQHATTTVYTGAVTISDSSSAWATLTAGSAFQDAVFGENANTTSFAIKTLDPASEASSTAPVGGFNYVDGKCDEGSTISNALVFLGDMNATVKDKVAAVFEVTDATGGTISYTRLRANLIDSQVRQYTNRMFQGRPNKVAVGDTVYLEGTVAGRVTGIQKANGFANSQLQMSDFTATAGLSYANWYVVAENLTDASTRIEPEVMVNELSQTVTIKQGLTRNKKTGLVGNSAPSTVYVGYKALRTDVTAASANPSVMAFASLTEVESLIGPVDPENPLAFALRTAFLHTTDIAVYALGVSDVTTAAPEGTIDSYVEALDLLALNENVYVLAPLTQNRTVHEKFAQHVTDLSAEKGRKERVAFVNMALPTEKEPALAATGNMTIGEAYGANGTKYDLTFTNESKDAATPLASLKDANGNPIVLSPVGSSASVTAEQGLYLTRANDPYKYLIVAVAMDGKSVTIDVDNVYGPGAGPGTGGNDDAFFHMTAPANFEADGEECGIWVRQAAVNTNTTTGKLDTCSALAEIAGGTTGYQNRRLFLVQPETVGLDWNGVEVLVPGYHICVADAARSGQLNPAQPFTNLPYTGFTRVVGSSDKFSENQMATAAAGGIWWVIKDTPASALACRHQLSTDVSTLKTREYSITRSVDYVAKIVRAQVKRFIGRNNITKALLQTLGLSVTAGLSSVIGTVVQSASVDGISQSTTNPDTVEIAISIQPFYPCNRIKITITV